MATLDDVLTLVSHVYTAATAPEHWSVVLELLADSVQGRATALLSHDFDSHGGAASVAVRMDPDTMHGYNAYYHAFDPYASRGLSGLHDAGFRVGCVGVGEQVISPDLLRRTAYYNEFSRGRDIFWMIGLPLVQVGTTIPAFLSTMRNENQKPFGVAETRLLSLLAPHLVRAIQIQRRLRGAQLRSETLEDVLDRLDVGLVLISIQGRVVFVNHAARRLVAARDGLWIDHGALMTVPSRTTLLREAIRQVIRTGTGDGIDHGRALRIPRSSGKRPLDVLVTLLVLSDDLPPNLSRSVAVFIKDVEPMVEPPADLLRRRYGLTAAESRIARELSAGRTLAQTAEICQIGQGTARWHLKHLLSKVGVRSQSQLARLIILASSGPRA
jgi:DNA-binding CsgD family transcriptional regulator